jgi:hypothetical protein
MAKTIIGIFYNRVDVEAAMDKFEAEGLNPKDISIVMKDTSTAEDIGDDTGAHVVGGAASGIATGAVIGGLAGLLAATIVPGLGGFLIGGPVGAALGLTGAAATTVSGVATGAVAGGLIGALMGLGLQREEAEYYEGRVKEGAILLAVPALDDQLSWVREVFDECNAADVKVITQPREEIAEGPRFARHHYDDTRSYATMGAKGGRTGHTKAKRRDE